jgi:hypothetical protein
MVDWSFLDADFFVRLGGGFLLVVVGAFMLLPKPRRPGNLAAGWFTLLSGLAFNVRIFEAQFRASNGGERVWATDTMGPTLYALAGIAAWLAAWHWPQRRAGPWTRLKAPTLVAGGGCALATAGALVLVARHEIVAPFAFSIAVLPVFIAGTSVLTCAATERIAESRHRDLAISAAALGTCVSIATLWSEVPLYALNVANNVANPDFPTVGRSMALLVNLGGFAPFMLGMFWMVRGTSGSHPRVALVAFLSTVALVMTIYVLRLLLLRGVDLDRDNLFFDSLPGLVRMLGAGILAWAIFRHDLLGVPLPDLGAHVARAATLFLFIAFVLAQALGNVLSGRMGLAVGAGVAVVSVALGPRLDHVLHRATSPEAVFRDAVELAWKDRKFTPDEERKLMVLAEELRIGVRRAYAIRDEVEGTRPTAGRR